MLFADARSVEEVRNGKSQVVNLAQLGLQGTCLGEVCFNVGHLQNQSFAVR